ncbi:MAG: M20 family metallopeptidase [Candidatus Nanohaloarchaea archaeon]
MKGEEFNVIEFLRKAVKTESHESVENFRKMMVKVLKEFKIDFEVDEAGNLIARKGSGKPHLLLQSHMDTVEPHIDFSEDEKTIRGRGSSDAKASIAAFLDTLINFDDEGGKLSLALTPDEETDSRAVGELDFSDEPDAVIVGEPTDCDVCNASRGRFEIELEVRGKSSHAARPEKGVNSIRAASKLISVLDDFDTGQEDEELGEPTLTPTVMEGGDASNVVPDKCRVWIDRRSVPGENMEEFMERFESFIDNLDFEAEVKVSRAATNSPLLGAFRTDPDTELVNILLENSAGELRNFDAVCEASYFAPEIPTVVFGPGKLEDEEGGVAHSRREYVEKEKVKVAADVLAVAVEDFMKSKT